MPETQETADVALVGRTELDALRRQLTIMVEAGEDPSKGIDPVAVLRQMGTLIRAAEDLLRSADNGPACLPGSPPSRTARPDTPARPESQDRMPPRPSA